MDNSNYCVCCGEEIPEGRMVCPACEKSPTITLSEKMKNGEIKKNSR